MMSLLERLSVWDVVEQIDAFLRCPGVAALTDRNGSHVWLIRLVCTGEVLLWIILHHEKAAFFVYSSKETVRCQQSLINKPRRKPDWRGYTITRLAKHDTAVLVFGSVRLAVFYRSRQNKRLSYITHADTISRKIPKVSGRHPPIAIRRPPSAIRRPLSSYPPRSNSTTQERSSQCQRTPATLAVSPTAQKHSYSSASPP